MSGEQRLLAYLAALLGSPSDMANYEREACGRQAACLTHRPQRSILWVVGHYQGMLNDLIAMIGRDDIVAFLEARQRIRDKMATEQEGTR